MKYLLIDLANLFFRARHGAHRASDTWEKVGFALHVTLMAANKMARRFEADHRAMDDTLCRDGRCP